VRVATPPGFEPIPQVVQRAQEIGEETGGGAEVTNDPAEACAGADVLYTDVWASMGQEEEAAERTLVFQSYRIDGAALQMAASDVIVLHCLPAHRGQEITDEVIDGPHSVVWDQAENRLHTQKALLLWLLERA
jgi:ornithine carbamoyltransferase